MSIKNTFSKLTGLGRLVVIVLLVGILGAGVFFGTKNSGINLGSPFCSWTPTPVGVQSSGVMVAKTEARSPSSTNASTSVSKLSRWTTSTEQHPILKNIRMPSVSVPSTRIPWKQANPVL